MVARMGSRERDGGRRTQEVEGGPATPQVLVPRFRLQVLEPRPEAPVHWHSSGDRCSIGSQPGNDIIIDDPTVSRYHCEVLVDAEGAHVRDTGSLNGTVVDGVRVNDAYLRDGSLIKLGEAVVRFQLGQDTIQIPLSERTSFETLVGQSVAMRQTISLLERAAATDATVLLEGETGTGKGATAESIHRASGRKDGPFVVVDCGAIPENLLESELFGHERGSFTGAAARRVGAFEEAAGGTLFLDEIGELPPELQPKLLRAVETRTIRRVGQNQHVPIDVRIVAATNRDLRSDANTGRFRSDLYFRLAVIKITLPPLRQRPEDLPLLAEALLATLRAQPHEIHALLTPAFLATLRRAAWPGNVRELRNYLERCLVFQDALPISGVTHIGEIAALAPGPPAADADLAYADARKRAIDAFEKSYAEALVRKHGGKVAAAAQSAGIARVHLYRLLRRHGLTPGQG